MEPTRFENGVNDTLTGLWARAPFVDPRRFVAYHEDFFAFDANAWTITTTEAGGSSASEALTDAVGGVLLVTNDENDNDADHFQKKGECFKFAAGKRLWFETRLAVSAAAQSDLQVGLIVTDTSPLDASDGVWFVSEDESASVDFVCAKNGVTSSVAAGVATLADATMIRLGFYYDGASTIEVYANDVHVASVTPGAALTATELAVSFGVVNGSAGAKTLSVDYITAIQER